MNLKRINAFRRKMTKFFTGWIGKSSSFGKGKQVDATTIKKILICRPNHRLGNLLMVTPLVQELERLFPESIIDILAKGGLAPIIFKNYDQVNEYILLPRKPFKELGTYIKIWIQVKFKKYDLVINTVKGSSSGKLLTLAARAPFKIFDEPEDTERGVKEDHMHMAKNAIYNLRYYLSKSGYTIENEAIPVLDINLTQDELEHGKQCLKELIDPAKETISIFTYATGAKCYSTAWWDSFYAQLTSTFPQYNFVEILPVENISQIGFKAPSFYSKDVREIAAVVANTAVFVAADSGIMHLGSASKTPTVGLFSVTNPIQYQPYGNGSVPVNTDETTNAVCMQIIADVLAKKKKN